MKNKLVLCLICLLFLSLPCLSQIIKRTEESKASFSYDTALFNHYLSEAIRLSESNRDSMRIYIKRAYRLARNRSYSKGLAEYYHFLAADYNEHSHYDSAMLASQKEIYWAKLSKDVATIAWAYNALANTYEYIGSMDSATTYFIKALDISESLQGKNTKLTGTLNYNLASVLFLIGNYERALGYANKGYVISKARKDTHMMANSLLDIGSIHVELKNYDTALSFFNRVASLVKHTKDSSYIMDILNDEGDLYAKRGQYTRSLKKYQQMLALTKKYNDTSELLYAYGNLGITQFQMKRFKEAAKSLNKAIQIGIKTDSRNELRQFYSALSEVEEAQHHFALSLQYRKNYDSLNELLMSESAKNNIHLLEVKYNTAQKDKQIALQNLELSRKQRSIERRNTWLFISLGGLIALAVILILSVRSYRHKKKLQQQSVLALQKQHELNTLSAKMEAREEERNRIGKEMHDDVGSALTTILFLSDDLQSHQTGKGKSIAAKISDTAGMVVDKMNEIIWSMNREYDTLDDLIAYSRQHAAQFLENHEIAYRFEVPDPIPDILLHGEKRRNIYLVIREALHNIVKHACASRVLIAFEVNKNLTVTIHDNGKGIDMDKLRRFGNGLRNMQQRMQSVGGSFEISRDNGTVIKLVCPLENGEI